jgi:tocopherol cyclase
MDHTICGSLNVQGENIDFNNGRGYIEKDWGLSFPSAYVWMQSNHFSKPGISIKCSVAKIPRLGSSFVGFIGGVWTGNRLVRFTTYNFSSLHHISISPQSVELKLENKNYHLKIISVRSLSTPLIFPIRGMMEGRIEESMTALIQVKLTDKKSGEVILKDTGRNAGLEVAGNISDLINK